MAERQAPLQRHQLSDPREAELGIATLLRQSVVVQLLHSFVESISVRWHASVPDRVWPSDPELEELGPLASPYDSGPPRSHGGTCLRAAALWSFVERALPAIGTIHGVPAVGEQEPIVAGTERLEA